jgi:choline monooxygenase
MTPDHANPFDIDADITRATTPTPPAYTDESIYQLAREAIFARSWQLIADLDDVKVPGAVHPVTFLQGCIDEPLILTRDLQDAIHCLSNVCTHRGTILAEHPDCTRSLTCRYHGRRFDLDGRCKHMPEFDQVEDFPSDADHLTRLQWGRWGSLIFAALDPFVPLDEWLAPVRDRLPWFDADSLTLDPARSRDYLVDANWALYCDNYLEGFHIPFVHASLNQTLDFSSYACELSPHAILQIGVSRDPADAFDLPADSPDHPRPIAGYYYFLFPNTMLNVYPWGVSVNIVKPLAVDRTRVSFLTYVNDPDRLDRGAGAGLDRVEREDEAVVEAVQRGMRSRLYKHGRYSPSQEQGVHHFHRMLARFFALPR